MLNSLTGDVSDLENHASDPSYTGELYKMAALMLDHRMRFSDRSLSACKLTSSGLFTAG
jgi:hypothetical protein